MAPIIAMTGFMGSGKTTVGRALAGRLGWVFIDLDEEVERLAGAGIPALFEERGESGFREWERRVLSDVLDGTSAQEGLVLSLGGGTLLDPDNVERVRAAATIVYLETDGEDAWKRVEGSDRPLARDREAFMALLESRRVSYEAAVDLTVTVGGESVEALVDALVRKLAERGLKV